jgi:hypothetical protein
MGYLGLDQRNEEPESITALGITHNLGVALRQLRHLDKPRVLWVDAICINQDDLIERSAEVMEMASIYSNAGRVVVWLGSSYDDSSLALQTLSRLGEGILYSSEQRELAFKKGSWAKHLQNHPEALVSKTPSWFAIRELLRREYFSRLWVFQEIGLATSAIVYVGEDRLDWQPFKLGLLWLWPMLGDLNQHIKNLAIEDFSSSSISSFLDITEEGDAGSRSLNSLLEKTVKLSCSDPRDRLYAIRGLTIPKEIDYIRPDYSKTTEEVFKGFTLRRILDAADGNILSRCLLQTAPANLHMPSWVPDLSLKDLPSLTVDFQAAGRSKIVAVSKGESLVAKGIRVATLTHVISFIKPSNTDSEIIERCRSWKQLCRSDTYARGGSTIDAFFEAILCGQIKEMLPLEFGNCMSLDKCKRVLENFGVEEDRDREGRNELNFLTTKLARNLRTGLRGRSFFRTREGFFGVCPECADREDQVFVLLGCTTPLILRPVMLQGKCCYRIVGESYVPGVMCTEALFGPLPPGWKVRYEYIAGHLTQVFRHKNTMLQQDPRALLPPEGRYRYGPFQAFKNIEATIPKHMLRQWFENVKTKQRTWADPRLTPQVLRKRGVDIQDLVLV